MKKALDKLNGSNRKDASEDNMEAALVSIYIVGYKISLVTPLQSGFDPMLTPTPDRPFPQATPRTTCNEFIKRCPRPKAGSQKGTQTSNLILSRIDHSINVGKGLYTFRINEQNYHRIGSLLLKDGTQPMYAQLWFFDAYNEVKNRLEQFHRQGISNGKGLVSFAYFCERGVVADFQENKFKAIHAPTVAEVAALITNDFRDGAPIRDIVINKNDSRPKKISELHPSYMALQ
nr:helicase [Tanacetum cinerariifolium]